MCPFSIYLELSFQQRWLPYFTILTTVWHLNLLSRKNSIWESHLPSIMTCFFWDSWYASSCFVAHSHPLQLPTSMFHPLLFDYMNWIRTYSWQTLMCGLIGIPPSNGVIPQSPMHTKSLATLKHQVIYPLWNILFLPRIVLSSQKTLVCRQWLIFSFDSWDKFH